MKEDKTPYIHNHILTIEERLTVIKENLKYICNDVKLIKKWSSSDMTKLN